jgi:hypothetical protein
MQGILSRERPDLPRLGRGRNSENLSCGDHEVVRVARVLDLAEPGTERGLEHGSRVVGAQLKPGTEPRVLIIGRVVGELDAQMPSAGKADDQHGLADARPLNGPHRAAAQGGLKAPGQLLAPVRAREDVHVAAKSDHVLAGLLLSFGPPYGQFPAVASSQSASSQHPVYAATSGAELRSCSWLDERDHESYECKAERSCRRNWTSCVADHPGYKLENEPALERTWAATSPRRFPGEQCPALATAWPDRPGA